ncbi:hypothetical protein [Roseospira marina]|uniref:hypothetical protein n=1 Tax=Roseospira marina TaxID=140057 RepID=UPI0017AD0B4E|nr:hypothetical protein [Roseospira marina]MBB5086861.1 hypothetical protein [Roseospira marina]
MGAPRSRHAASRQAALAAVLRAQHWIQAHAGEVITLGHLAATAGVQTPDGADTRGVPPALRHPKRGPLTPGLHIRGWPR